MYAVVDTLTVLAILVCSGPRYEYLCVTCRPCGVILLAFELEAILLSYEAIAVLIYSIGICTSAARVTPESATMKPVNSSDVPLIHRDLEFHYACHCVVLLEYRRGRLDSRRHRCKGAPNSCSFIEYPELLIESLNL